MAVGPIRLVSRTCDDLIHLHFALEMAVTADSQPHSVSDWPRGRHFAINMNWHFIKHAVPDPPRRRWAKVPLYKPNALRFR